MQAKRTLLTAALFGVASLVGTGPLAAQNVSRYTFGAGAGFSTPVKDTGGHNDVGFDMNAAGGINLNSHLGVLAEFGFDHFDLNNATLAAAGVPGGTTRLYHVTLEPIFHFNQKGRFDPYIIGGGGYYRRTVEFTQPVLAGVTVFDPFLFGLVNVPVVANQVLGSYTQNKAGWNIGAGAEFRVKEDSNAKIFAEARYHYIYTTPLRTTMIPVTFGFRW